MSIIVYNLPPLDLPKRCHFFPPVSGVNFTIPLRIFNRRQFGRCLMDPITPVCLTTNARMPACQTIYMEFWLPGLFVNMLSITKM